MRFSSARTGNESRVTGGQPRVVAERRDKSTRGRKASRDQAAQCVDGIERLQVCERVTHAEDQISALVGRKVIGEVQQVVTMRVDCKALDELGELAQERGRGIDRQDPPTGAGQWDRVHPEASTKIDRESTRAKNGSQLGLPRCERRVCATDHP